MPSSRQAKLQDLKSRSVSQTSALSKISAANSSVSEFLEEKVKSCELDIEYLKGYQDGLIEVLKAEKISKADYRQIAFSGRD
jgi:hypothetical protein